MQFTQEQLAQFKKIYLQEFKIELTDAEALEKAIKVYRMVEILSQTPPFQKSKKK